MINYMPCRIEGTTAVHEERLIVDGHSRHVSVAATSCSGHASSSAGSAASACGDRRGMHMILCHTKPRTQNANTSHSFRFLNSYNSCPESCSRSKGKRRNAWYEFTFFSSLLLQLAFLPRVPHTRSAISSILTSEGFIMVPDTRMSLFVTITNDILNRVLDSV